MKKRLLVILILSFALLLLLNSLLLISQSKKELQNEQKQTDKYQQLHAQYNALYGNIFLQYLSEDYIFKDIVGEKISGEKVYLNGLMSDNYPKLILRITDNHCSTCVEAALNDLLKYKEDIGVEHIIILSSYKNKRSLHAFSQKNNVNEMIINTSTKIEIPIEEYDVPYFYVLDRDMKIKLLFIPVKEISGYTEQYLKNISKRFFIDSSNDKMKQE